MKLHSSASDILQCFPIPNLKVGHFYYNLKYNRKLLETFSRSDITSVVRNTVNVSDQYLSSELGKWKKKLALITERVWKGWIGQREYL